MSDIDLQRIAAFRSAFARRQAAKVTEFPGGAVVLDPNFPDSHEHNQIVIDAAASPAELPALADTALAHLRHRQITVLNDTVGTECAPALTAAGYSHEITLVMKHSGPAAAPDDLPAQPVALADLRPGLVRQLRVWMPQASDTVINQLADRREARLRGAERVEFLAVHDEYGIVRSWGDLYCDPDEGIAQIEDVVTADTHLQRGYADTLLATALQHASDCDLIFLLADPNDWPRTWYARRGFTPLGRSHAFTRSQTEG